VINVAERCRMRDLERLDVIPDMIPVKYLHVVFHFALLLTGGTSPGFLLSLLAPILLLLY